ncbi:glycogen operon protein GlgX homolog [Planctomycetales bacterium]|nr:glycogen operon protein GlgX homolog [Planctomycetales bacterium]GHS96867.1 glycogen operon protein GlgX homolog [Planctomycetales bacterium]
MPLDTIKFKTARGTPLPFGATRTPRGVNFSIFSRHATGATLVLFATGVSDAVGELELDPNRQRTGQCWHIEVFGLNDNVRYGWRIDGPFDPKKGLRFDRRQILIDPYAKSLTGGATWGEPQIRRTFDPEKDYHTFPRRGCLPPLDFDWGDAVPLRTPLSDTIIYELHVRGFTIDQSSGVKFPGTYSGLIEKIPYLQELGITAVELMPVFEFDENENVRVDPQTGKVLRNYWGYSPICFFAPKASYASAGQGNRAITEFREMVRALHAAGIEVILDVVFNHTGEGDERGPTISFRGIDDAMYYIHDRQGKYANFSGCGNTFNCNQPAVQSFIIDSLRYWVAEMHVDGFRFDLASILGRGPDGEVLKNPPLLERIAKDPVLADAKIIAEAWDAAGLNQVGRFPGFGRWSEWNGYFRDNFRAFWRGDDQMLSPVASRICASDDLYHQHPWQSINFITAHDGFTLNDLVSYQKKNNAANGEENIDGENNNLSQNFGVEGETADAEIRKMRRQMQKNFIASLLVSQGTPMFVAGDEFSRTQRGNNNAYCQDNELSWVDWTLATKNADLLRFTRLMIALRKRHWILRRRHFFEKGKGISWHGEKVGQPAWDSHHLAFLLDGDAIPNHREPSLFVMLNASTERHFFEVPDVGKDWLVRADTERPSPFDFAENDAPNVGRTVAAYRVRPRSMTILETAE